MITASNRSHSGEEDLPADELEAHLEELIEWVITELGDIVETALAKKDCRLGTHALRTLAKLGGFIPSAPPGTLLMLACDWILRVRANEAAAKARDTARVRRCGARRKRGGQACVAKPLANGRCKFHGGMSTGPKTSEGRERALANLRHRGQAGHYSEPALALLR